MFNKERSMPEVRDELLVREITRAELKELVDEWVAAGGKIKQCKPADAYSFHMAPLPTERTFNGKVRMRRSLRNSLVGTGPAKVATPRATKTKSKSKNKKRK
jgi:hypothetical protein